MTGPAVGAGGALQYRSVASPVHALGAGWKLLAASGCAALALAVDGPVPLAGLTLLVAAGYAVARLGPRALWRDARWLLLQGVVVVLLTLALRGPAGLPAGGRTALQLLLCFLPFALVLRTTRSEALLASLRGWLPERLGFAAGATARLAPVLARELADLVTSQRLRGARLRARDAWRPGAWRDWLACVAFPMTVRAVELSEAMAEAAEIRGVGVAEARRDPSFPEEEPT